MLGWTHSHSRQTGPIDQYHPLERTVRLQSTHINHALVPPFTSPKILSDPQHAEQLLEWLSLATLDSPRIRAGDDISSFLSRYEVPTFGDDIQDLALEATSRKLVRLQWHGFVPARSVARLWSLVSKAATGRDWAALSVCAFGGRAYAVLGLEGLDVLTWECD